MVNVRVLFSLSSLISALYSTVSNHRVNMQQADLYLRFLLYIFVLFIFCYFCWIVFGLLISLLRVFWVDCLHIRAIVVKRQNFLIVVVLVIIIDHLNQTNHLYEVRAAVIDSRAILVAVMSECS